MEGRLRVGGIGLLLLLLVAAFPDASSLYATAVDAGPPDPMTVREPILIEGNADFTSENGVTSGSGTSADPYVIEDWQIGGGSRIGIEIRNTTAPFVIRNVTVHNGSTAAIDWHNVANAVLEDSNLTGAYHGFQSWGGSNLTVVRNDVHGNQANGLYLFFPDGALVADNLVRDNDEGVLIQNALSPGPVYVTRNEVASQRVGIVLSYSTRVIVSQNRIVDNWQYQGYEEGGTNAWDGGYPEGGNFWSDHSGWDDCSGPAQDVCPDPDGFGDLPYAVPGDATDRYPIVTDSPPNIPPLAAFGYSGPVHVGIPVTFDASSSQDTDGYPLRYTWDFGDGTRAEDAGRIVTHTYYAAGTFVVTLNVTDIRRATAETFAEVRVESAVAPPPPPEPLVLTSYEHRTAGFRLPIPVGWSVQENAAFGNVTIELVLLGPYRGNVPTNILVDTEEDATVRETDAYLLDAVEATLAGLREGNPNVVVIIETPNLRTIADHAAVTFAVQHSTGVLYQKIAIVVSEPHRRFWVLVLTTDGESYPVLDEGFERMLAGFEITRAAPADPSTLGPISPLLVLLLAGGVGVFLFGVLVVVLLGRSRTTARPPARSASAPTPAWIPPTLGPSPPIPATMQPARSGAIRFCPMCGTPAAVAHSFCPRCGAPLRQ